MKSTLGCVSCLKPVNPADESILGEAPVGSAAQVEAAIAAARNTFDNTDWAQRPVQERQVLLTRFGGLRSLISANEFPDTAEYFPCYRFREFAKKPT